MTTRAWPSCTPLRLSLAGSVVQPAWHFSTDVVSALAVMVTAMEASSSQVLLDIVRSFVHSARSASGMGTAVCMGSSASRLGVSAVQGQHGGAQGGGRPGAEDQEAGPGRQREAAVVGQACG